MSELLTRSGPAHNGQHREALPGLFCLQVKADQGELRSRGHFFIHFVSLTRLTLQRSTDSSRPMTCHWPQLTTSKTLLAYQYIFSSLFVTAFLTFSTPILTPRAVRYHTARVQEVPKEGLEVPRLPGPQRPQDRGRDAEAVHPLLGRQGRGRRRRAGRVAEQARHHHPAVRAPRRAVLTLERDEQQEHFCPRRQQPEPGLQRRPLVPFARLAGRLDTAAAQQPVRPCRRRLPKKPGPQLRVAVVHGDPPVHRDARRRAGVQLLPVQLCAGDVAAQPRLPRLFVPLARQRATRPGPPLTPRLLRHRHDRVRRAPKGSRPAAPGGGDVPPGAGGYVPGYRGP